MTYASLNKTRHKPNDEVPTPIYIFELGEELMRWKKRGLFKGKTLFLPCDDYRWSGFSKWFIPRMTEYGIKKLICRSYEKQGHGKLYINENGKEWVADTQGQGSFLEPEAEKYRDEADFILTNPPYSLKGQFGEWANEKSFCIILPPFLATNSRLQPHLLNKQWTFRQLPQRKNLPPVAWVTNIKDLIPLRKLPEKNGDRKVRTTIDNIEILNRVQDYLPNYEKRQALPITALQYELENDQWAYWNLSKEYPEEHIFDRVIPLRKNETQNTPLPRGTTPSLFD